MNLYELNEALRSFEFQVDENGELLNADALDALQLARDEKIENICLWVKNLAAEIEALKAEAKNLTERARAKENTAERLRRYLAANLNGEPFETARCKVNWRKTEKVEVDNDFITWALLNRDDLLTYSRPTPDKAAIKAALKAGEEIAGAKIVADKSMSIK